MYSGSGTQADPYIVSTWADFLSVIGVNNAYIKWAEAQSKVLSETITINQEITSRAAEVDFNGWTFSNMEITKTYDSTRPFIFNVGTAVNWYNLTVSKLTWNNPRHYLKYGQAINLYNCFFDDITVNELPSSNVWWTYGGSDTAGGTQTGIFNGCALYCCILYLNTKNANIIYPKGTFYFCEIYANYKYELDNAYAPAHGLFMRGTSFNMCYVAGKVDVSRGTGSFDIVRAWDNSELNTAGVQTWQTVFNIETKISQDCGVSQTHIRTWGVSGEYKSFFVTNNGGNYTAYNNTITDCAKGLLSDLRNSNELDRESFHFMEDDKTRHPQYAKNNASQDWLWRKHVNVNTGIVFLPFWKYPTGGQPIPEGGDVYENPYLTVYDMDTRQNEFDNHGLAILRPTSGRVVEELNGEYSLTFQHPRDPEDKWQYILEMNVVKALGQLFVIQKVDEVQTGGSGYVSAYAEHITYTLNDKWIFPPVTIAGYDGQTLIDSIMDQATDLGYDWQNTYSFDVTTDLDAPVGFRDWYEMSDGVTPYEMLLGGNGFIAKLGGELYRDNFTMKINERMHGAQDNAFELAIGYNLTGIKRTVDLTTFCTYLRGYDITDGTYDNWFAIGWDPSTLPRPYPREVVRSTNFFYDHPEYAEEGQLDRDTMNFFNQQCAPLISYELNVVDLRRNPDYKMFTNNYRFKVGDKGRVWDERLQSWIELEITRTEKDIITGDCVRVVIGTQRSFTRPVGYMPVVPRGIIIPAAQRVMEGIPPLEFVTSETALVDWIIYGAAGGVGEVTLGTNMFSYSSFKSSIDGVQNGSISWDDTNEGFTVTATDNDAYTYPYGQNYHYQYAYKMPVQANKTYRLTWSADNNNAGMVYVFFNGSEVAPFHNANNANTKQLEVTTDSDTTVITVRFGVTTAGNSIKYSDIKIQAVEYYIPVTITQRDIEHYATADGHIYHTADNTTYSTADNGQSQTVNIPINHPLEEGESISLADTGIDIPTYVGENVLDVDTSVKPRVRITYKEE